MATYTSIPAFTSGQVLTSSVMNDVKNNLDLGNAQSAYPYRNLIYNGAMQVAQRGTSTASITSGGVYYTADRWLFEVSSLGTWTNSTEADGPSGSGIARSFKLLCTTADASPAAGDYMLVEQRLEGQDLQRLKKGTASADTLTLSFWVKSNVTGTYVCRLRDVDNTRHVCKTYTVSASGTWEKKEIAFPADVTGAFDNDNAHSLSVQFWLGAGTTYTSGTLATSWASVTSANIAPGQTNLASAINNYWQITGVQLEAGSVSTPFEFLPYGDELARCQRYFYRVTSHYMGLTHNAVDLMNGALKFPVTMRAAPQLQSGASWAPSSGSAGTVAVRTVSGTDSSADQIPLCNSGSNWSFPVYCSLTASFSADL